MWEVGPSANKLRHKLPVLTMADSCKIPPGISREESRRFPPRADRSSAAESRPLFLSACPSHSFFPGQRTHNRHCEEYTMPSQVQGLISLFRPIVLLGVTAFLITSAVLPMAAQNSIPPTAVQAARMPQFASRLAHPAWCTRPARRIHASIRFGYRPFSANHPQLYR